MRNFWIKLITALGLRRPTPVGSPPPSQQLPEPEPIEPPQDEKEPYQDLPIGSTKPPREDEVYFDNYAPDDLQERYHRMYKNLEIKCIGRQLASHVTWNLNMIRRGQDRYMRETEEINDMLNLKGEGRFRWELLAALHGLEGGYDFNKQILNGQPWNMRTTIVPRNLGPFRSWSEACAKAFEIKRLPERWTIPNTLYFMLTFNGLGYLNRGLYSPYLWSYSQYYADQGGGKFTRDHHFDRSFISLQVGGAILLKKLNY
jgi:lysozyme family protein